MTKTKFTDYCPVCTPLARAVKPLVVTCTVQRKNNVWRLIFAFLIAALRFLRFWDWPAINRWLMSRMCMRKMEVFLAQRMLQVEFSDEKLETSHPNCRMMPIVLPRDYRRK